MLITPQYEAFYGSVERAGKHSIQTLFYHLAGFPLWPQDSYLVSGNTLFGGELKVMEIKRNKASIVAGYARGWTTMGAISLLLLGVGLFFIPEAPFPEDPMPLGHSILSYLLVAGGVGAAVLAVAAWFFTRGALSDVELAKRVIYEEFVGAPLDPAQLNDPWSIRDDLKRHLGSVGESGGLGRAFDRWPEVAMHPQLASPEVLRMALTLTRLCLASPEKEAPRDAATLASIHDAVWQRLVQIDPSTLSRRP